MCADSSPESNSCFVLEVSRLANPENVIQAINNSNLELARKI